LPIVIAPGVIRKITEEKRSIPIDLLKKMPTALRDPIFVFDSASVPDAQTVFIDLRHEGANLIVAIHLNRKAGRTEVNRIASVYGKTNEMAAPEWIKAGLLRFAHQQKSRAWFQSRGLQLPKEGSKHGNPNLLTEADFVNSRSLASYPAEDEASIAELMAELRKTAPLSTIGQKLSEGAPQAEGEQTVGRPDLANPAGPDAASRRVVNAVDEARKESAERQTHEEWRNQAVAMLAKDRNGVLRDLLAKARDGLALDNPVQVKAAQLLVNDLIQKAVSSKDPAAMQQAQILAYSYRAGGTEQARAARIHALNKIRSALAQAILAGQVDPERHANIR
jgi:hypothetical protein